MDPDRALFLGETYVRLKRPERALKALERAAPENALTWLWRSNALHDLRRHQEAADSARRGIAIDAESPYLYLALARAELGLGHADNAEAAVKESLRVWPEYGDAHAMHALILATTGRHEAAERVSSRATSLSPDELAVRLTDAYVALRGGRSEDADRQSAALLADAPDEAAAHWLRGIVLLHRPWGRNALWHFREAARLDPANDLYARAARGVGHWSFRPIRATGGAVAVAAITRVLAAATGVVAYMFDLIEPKYFWMTLLIALYFNIGLTVMLVKAEGGLGRSS